MAGDLETLGGLAPVLQLAFADAVRLAQALQQQCRAYILEGTIEKIRVRS